MIKKEDLEELGSTDLVTWMRESMIGVEEEFAKGFNENTSVFHIVPSTLKGFKASVEQYAKEHPNAKIKASGFMISTDENKNDEYEYKDD